MDNLSIQAQSLWGKKTVENGQELWLPLLQHLIDTKNVINWLFYHWLSEGERQTLYADLPEQKLQPLVKFLGFIHDFGKATPAFQLKTSYGHNEHLDYELISKLVRHGFLCLDECALSNQSKSPHSVAGEALLEKYGVNNSVGAIIGGHHGKPQRFSPIFQLEEYSSNYFQSDQNTQVQLRWQKVQHEILNYGLNICGFQRAADIPSISQPSAVILEGLLIMADWLASTEYLTVGQPLFPLVSLDKGLADIDAKTRFERGISVWAANDENWQPVQPLSIAKYYQSRWGFSPYSLQKKMSAEIGRAIDPGMIIIEAPMGIGKTEIALTAAEQLAAKRGEDGFFMGLPTQATTDAMFSRVERWLLKEAKAEDSVFDIKLMHGKSQFNQEYMHLPSATDINDDSSGVAVNSWFSGKKSILTKFTVGTIDNLLLMGLKQRHLFLKHLAFSGKVVIIDEVHAYDVYMSSYLKKALEWLGAYHVPVIALSATLPRAKRNELLKAYAKGKLGRQKLHGQPGWEENSSYPLLSILDGDKVVQAEDYSLDQNQIKTIKINRLSADDAAIIYKASSLIANGGIAGVIVNTIKRAQKLCSLVPKDIPCLLLHSAFLAPDRAKLEEKLQSLIGKKGKRPHRLIVIGTQVLEQSLDIDFDVLFTDLAPVDLIFQRIGRLHRHQIERPSALKTPTVYLLGANKFGDYSDADKSIYGRYLLAKTDYFLDNSVRLPLDIPKYVQQVYSSENDAQIKGLGSSGAEFKDKLTALQRKANKFQIKAPRPKKTIWGWLDKNQVDIDKDDLRAQAAVRDIQETLEVVLIKRGKDGFYLLNGQRYDLASPKEVAQQLIRLPAAATPDIAKAINALEVKTQKDFSEWEENVWLRGSLAFILDDNNAALFNGWKFKYSRKLGLVYQKEDKDDQKKI